MRKTDNVIPFGKPAEALDLQFTEYRTFDKSAQTKELYFDEKGELASKPSPQLWRGTATRVSVPSLQAFGERMHITGASDSSISHGYGVSSREVTDVVTKRMLATGAYPDALARTPKYFPWRSGSPGFMFNDYDVPKGGIPLTPDEYVEKLKRGCPYLDCELLISHSASSFIYDISEDLLNPKLLRGQRGLHAHNALDDMAEMPRIVDRMFQDLFFAGFGEAVISKSGAILPRTLVDRSVTQSNRLNFMGMVVTPEGLYQCKPLPFLYPGKPLLRARSVKPPWFWKTWKAECQEWLAKRAERVEEADEVNRLWKIARKAANPTLDDATLDWGVHEQILYRDCPITLEDGATVTVHELYKQPDLYDGWHCRVPLQEDYAALGLIWLGGKKLFISTFAHGGMLFKLLDFRAPAFDEPEEYKRELVWAPGFEGEPAAEIDLVQTEKPEAVRKALKVLGKIESVFAHGSDLVKVKGEVLHPLEDQRLLDLLDYYIAFFQYDKDGERYQTSAPDWLAKRILKMIYEGQFRGLKNIITAPTVRIDGTLLSTPGFDPVTGLYLVPGAYGDIKDNPGDEDAWRTFYELWHPFEKFPFVSAAARAAHLAGILTANVRPALGTAPGFNYDAGMPGTGKTLICQCLAAIAGVDIAPFSPTAKEEETEKRITALLRSGLRCLFLDNFDGEFESASMEMLLTTPRYRGRILGESTIWTGPSNVLVLFSGNNFRPMKALFRRILTCRLDARRHDPERRSFDLDPLAYCLEHRQKLAAATCTILRAFARADMPRFTKDRLASYDDWDNLVRQAVIWLGSLGIKELTGADGKPADPVSTMDKLKEQSPERQKLANLLAAVRARFEKERWLTSQLIDAADAEGNRQFRGLGETPLYSLFDALDEACGDAGKRFNPRRVGRWIEGHEDDYHPNGLHFERAGKLGGKAVWRVADNPKDEA